jgi:2-dehydro-3-deoxyphosphogluconate aldolase/(4S)-4-hydroxy-2-oxoglutarate aldolase
MDCVHAVVRGGITMIEITFTVPDAVRVMAELAAQPNLTVGAGTVLTAAQAHDALAAGAKFIVAPNTSTEVARVALDAGVFYMPGAFTPNEILAARAAGAHVVKVHPVGVVGGPHYIDVIREPLPDIPMLAAGGTTLENSMAFLKAGCVGVGLGPSLADPKLAKAEQFDEITRRARAFLQRLTAADAAAAPARRG